jgi:maleate isomerase
MAADLGAIIGQDVFATTNGLDMQAALRSARVKRPFLVMPPWFGDDNVKAGLAYFSERGFAPAGHLRYDPGPGWRDMPRGELYAKGMGFAQQIEPLYAQIRAACPAEADGVLIGGTGFRCVGIIEALEQALRAPVISANQASLWHCLRRVGVNTSIDDYGILLRMPQYHGHK